MNDCWWSTKYELSWSNDNIQNEIYLVRIGHCLSLIRSILEKAAAALLSFYVSKDGHPANERDSWVFNEFLLTAWDLNGNFSKLSKSKIIFLTQYTISASNKN